MAVKTVPVKKKFMVRYEHDSGNGQRTFWAHNITGAKNAFYNEVPGGKITEIYRRVAMVTEVVTTKIVNV